MDPYRGDRTAVSERGPHRRGAHHDGRAPCRPGARVQPLVRGRPLLFGRDARPVDVRRSSLGRPPGRSGPAGSRWSRRRPAPRRRLLHLALLDHRGPRKTTSAGRYRHGRSADAPRTRSSPSAHTSTPRSTRYRFGLVRDPGPMQPHLALHAPFIGLLVEVVDAPAPGCSPTSRRGCSTSTFPRIQHVARGHGHRLHPGAVHAGPDRCPRGPRRRSSRRRRDPLCLLWFLDRDPFVCVPDAFAAHHRALADSPLGELRFSGAFVPTVVGTDRYVDELR